MKAKYIVSDRDRKLLEHNGFNSFESLWNARLDWFEEPNYRRNGWSGVSRHVLNGPDGSDVVVFIKRQQNHNFRSCLHPIRGLPTLYREYRNLCKLKTYGIPCAELVFYEHRNIGGHWQAILITRSLSGYRPMEACLDSIKPDDVAARRALLASVAQMLSRIHGHRLRHGSLYAKHVLVRVRTPLISLQEGAYEFHSAVVDLERMRVRFPLFQLALDDLDQLYRRWRHGEGDWEVFVGSYLACIERAGLGRRVERAVIRKCAMNWTKPGQSGSPGSCARQLIRSALHTILGGSRGDNAAYVAANAGSRPGSVHGQT